MLFGYFNHSDVIDAEVIITDVSKVETSEINLFLW